jgi:probable HAF family extracellular repeat protein
VIEPLPLPAHTPGVPFFSQAFDINEAGDIVGTTGGSGQQQATLWRNGQVIPLGVMPGFAQSIAGEINDAGLIAGRSLTFGASSAARAHTISFAPANTPPTLTLPASLTVDATSPGGAVVSFAAMANDAEDGAFLPACMPASGSIFAIGTTTVSCTATDSGGLDATGSFTVTVLGATAQIDALVADVTGVGPRSLENTLRVARAAIVAQRPLTAAVMLTVFDLQVTVLAIARRLPASEALELLAASRQIRATIGF